MKEYIASVRFEGEVFEMKREYRTKAAFRADLLENGFSVRFITTAEKYDEDVAKYYERLEHARDNARIKRQVRRELKTEYGIDY